MRQMLVATARPVPGHGAHEVGAGFVCRETTLAYLREFGARCSPTCSCGGAPPSVPRLAASFAVWGWPPTANSRLWTCWAGARLRTTPRILRTGEIHATMRDPELIGGEQGFRKQPAAYA
jgi:hypothetical protein